MLVLVAEFRIASIQFRSGGLVFNAFWSAW